MSENKPECFSERLVLVVVLVLGTGSWKIKDDIKMKDKTKTEDKTEMKDGTKMENETKMKDDTKMETKMEDN